MTADPDHHIIDLAHWCPTCRRPLDHPSPGTHHDDLVHLDPTTGRWQHTLCLIATRTTPTQEATTTTVPPSPRVGNFAEQL